MSLKDIDSVNKAVRHGSAKAVKLLGKILDPNLERLNRNKILNFKGFEFVIDDDNFKEKIKEIIETFSLDKLITVCNLLNISGEGQIEDLVKRIITCLTDLETLKKEIIDEELSSEEDEMSDLIDLEGKESNKDKDTINEQPNMSTTGSQTIDNFEILKVNKSKKPEMNKTVIVEKDSSSRKSQTIDNFESLTLNEKTDQITETLKEERPDIISFDPALEINFGEWLLHFKAKTINLGNDWRKNNFHKFIRGSALKLFINNCLHCQNFDEIVNIFEEQYFIPAQGFCDFQNLNFNGRPKDLIHYFTQKVELGRKINLSNSHIIEGLSVGMPHQIKTMPLIKEPSTPKEWLQLVSKFIHDIPMENKNNYQNSNFQSFKNRDQPQSYRQWNRPNQYPYRQPDSPRQNFVPREQNFNKPPQFRQQTPFVRQSYDSKNQNKKQVSHLSQELPPNPCKYCTEVGILNAYHWGQTCIHKPSSSRVETNKTERKTKDEQNEI